MGIFMKFFLGALFSFIFGLVFGRILLKKQESLPLDYWRNLSGKNRKLFDVTNEFFHIKQQGYVLDNWFKKHSYKDIAIYGMANLGNRFADELLSGDVNIAYGIDKNTNIKDYKGIKIVSPNMKLENVDAVVVTVPTYFYEIRKDLQEKIDCPIISLEEILYQISDELVREKSNGS